MCVVRIQPYLSRGQVVEHLVCHTSDIWLCFSNKHREHCRQRCASGASWPPQRDGAGGGGEGRGGDLMAGASRQVVAGDSLLVFPKTWRRRLAVRRAGVADRGREDELTVRRRSRSGGKAGGRAADGVRRPGGPPPGAGGVVGPLLRAQVRSLWPAQVNDVRRPLLPCCPLPTCARHSPTLVCAGGPVASRLRPSAGTAGCGGRLEGAGRAWSLALPAALDVMPCAHVQDAWFAGRGRASLCQDGGQQVVGWGRAHAPRALCRGRCGGRAVYGCFLCPLDTSPTPSSSCTAVEASRLRSVGLGRNTRGMRVT